MRACFDGSSCVVKQARGWSKKEVRTLRSVRSFLLQYKIEKSTQSFH